MKFKEFVGIDISKLTFDVVLQSNQAFIQCSNKLEGFKKLVNWSIKQSQFTKDETLFCMEHTGIYSLPLASYFAENGFHFIMIPGLQIKRSMGIQRGKDDKIDAKRIAQYAYQKRDSLHPSTLPAKDILYLRKLMSLRDRYVKQKAGFLKDKKEYRDFLKHSENKFIFQMIDSSIRELEKKIAKIECEMKKIVENNELIFKQYMLITSIKGVGMQTAISVIVLTNCFENFQTWRQFASYSGTAPFPYRSGTSIKGKTKVSQLANKKMKALLNMCARTAIQYNHEIKAYYERKIANGDNPMAILNNVRNKLLARIFAVVQRGTPYVNTYKFAS